MPLMLSIDVRIFTILLSKYSAKRTTRNTIQILRVAQIQLERLFSDPLLVAETGSTVSLLWSPPHIAGFCAQCISGDVFQDEISAKFAC